MIKVLINAYACSPNMGSEPGMAWNWCLHLAKHCELYIITEGEFRDRIEAVVPTLPQGNNLHFYYNYVGGDDTEKCEKIRKMCWNQGDWRFYKYYREWQWKTYLMAKEICKSTEIDILHQLNMIGFREPGYLWKLAEETGIKFVWGPLDAKERFPLAYTEGAGFKTKVFLWLKNTITYLQLKHSRRVREAIKTSDAIISASSNSVNSLRKYFHTDSILLNETGCSNIPVNITKTKVKNNFNILWVGKMDFRKQLSLAMRAIAIVNKYDIRLNIVGGGNNKKYRKEAVELGIDKNCVWHGVVNHNEVQELMQMSNLFLFTSVAEGTPHVVLEAIANHLPIVCFDTCGQGDVVNENVGIKIPLTNPKKSVEDFAKVIAALYDDRKKLESLSENCTARSKELSWDNKAIMMVQIYKDVLGIK